MAGLNDFKAQLCKSRLHEELRKIAFDLYKSFEELSAAVEDKSAAREVVGETPFVKALEKVCLIQEAFLVKSHEFDVDAAEAMVGELEAKGIVILPEKKRLN